MKYTTTQQTRETPYTIDGKTQMVTTTREVRVPKLPRDAKALVLNTILAGIALVTLVAAIWSTVCIGTLLGGSPLAYAASAVYDISWLIVMALEWVYRLHENTRTYLRRLGWGFLGLTAGLLFASGMAHESFLAASGGACFSALAKGLWVAYMRAQEVPFTDEQRQWIAKEFGDAYARSAVVDVHNEVDRVESNAVARRLVRERENAELAAILGGTPATVQRDANGEVPQANVAVPEPAREPSETERGLHVVKGTTTAAIRDLVGQGVTNTEEIRNALASSGVRVPDASYIRRLTRDARTDRGTGSYL